MISAEYRPRDEFDDDLDQETTEETQKRADRNHGDDHSRTPPAGRW
jgi:hypothetical protein